MLRPITLVYMYSRQVSLICASESLFAVRRNCLAGLVMFLSTFVISPVSHVRRMFLHCFCQPHFRHEQGLDGIMYASTKVTR